MNTSIHDSCNLAWKLNLVIRGLAKPSLLKTYGEERRQVAEDLQGFDIEHTNAFSSGDMQALAHDFRRGARFTSGYGADYPANMLNVPQKGSISGALRAGSLPPPAKVSRHFDSNPVDIQLDIPLLGQFRIYFFAKTIDQTKELLEVISAHALSYTSVLGKMTCAANASYTLQPPLAASSDVFTRPERYTTVSGIFTFALVLQQEARDIELEELPQLWRNSRFTVYADDLPHLDTRYMRCTDKWLGAISGSEVGIVVLRPDGYVGTVGRFIGRSKETGKRATKWLDDYFDGEIETHAFPVI
jgi:phenol 2-monooxygenase